MPFVNALSFAINRQKFSFNMNIPVSPEQVIALFGFAVDSVDGSMMEEQFTRLLSSLVQSNPGFYVVFSSLTLPDHFLVILKKVNSDIDNVVQHKIKYLVILSILASSCNGTSKLTLESGIMASIRDKLSKALSIAKPSVQNQVGKFQ